MWWLCDDNVGSECVVESVKRRRVRRRRRVFVVVVANVAYEAKDEHCE